MNQYHVEVIANGGPRATPNQHAGGIQHDLNVIQEQLGDRWELVSCTDGPRPYTIVTIWARSGKVEAEVLRTGRDWMHNFGHQIMDFDGWRDGVDFLETEITLDDYRRRYNRCTVNGLAGNQDF